MKRSVFITLVAICFLFFACSDSNTQTQEKAAIPKALQEKSQLENYSARSGYGDLIESLYSDVVEKSPELKNLETEISNLRENKDDSLKLFNDFNSKSKSYYSSATHYMRQVSDSVLRKEIASLIQKSSANYDASVLPFTNLLKAIDTKTASLSDLHILLKLKTTLPLIENYQKNNLPSVKPIQGYLNNIDQTVKRADTLVKKY